MLSFDSSTEKWDLTNSQNEKLANYSTSDLRISLVWRSVCFKTKAEMESWDPKNSQNQVNGEEILQILETDLRQKGVLNGPRPDPLNFALLLLDEYVKYPFDNKALFPLNYCALPELFKNYWFYTYLSQIC